MNPVGESQGCWKQNQKRQEEAEPEVRWCCQPPSQTTMEARWPLELPSAVSWHHLHLLRQGFLSKKGNNLAKSYGPLWQVPVCPLPQFTWLPLGSVLWFFHGCDPFPFGNHWNSCYIECCKYRWLVFPSGWQSPENRPRSPAPGCPESFSVCGSL